jgi:hypothetical protein
MMNSIVLRVYDALDEPFRLSISGERRGLAVTREPRKCYGARALAGECEGLDVCGRWKGDGE